MEHDLVKRLPAVGGAAETFPDMRVTDYVQEEVWLPCSLDVLGWDTDFHDLMLNDRLRMNAYARAIKAAVLPGMLVLDLGTGTGILAQWALEAGAARVYGIEVNEKILAVAVDKLQRAGVADRFTPLHGMSYDIHLPEPVDLIMSEILGNIGDNEDCARILDDARRRFLKPSGTMLPLDVTTFFVPVSSIAAHYQIAGGRCRSLAGDYDLSLLHSQFGITNPFNLYYDAILPERTYLSRPQQANRIDFLHGGVATDYVIHLSFAVEEDGLLTGFKGYFRTHLTPCTVLDIGGDDIEGKTTSDSWKHCYLPLEHPLQLKSGDVIAFSFERGADTGTGSSFSCRYTWRGTIWREGRIHASFNQEME